MRISYRSGIEIKEGDVAIHLDPTRGYEGSVVSHAHLDHLMPKSFMTFQTKDIMFVRKGSGQAEGVEYDKEFELKGFSLAMRKAGHVFGSAMIRVNDLLYTGDFNPDGGKTCGKALPEECNTLIIEATYGRSDLTFPEKEEVLNDLLAWAEICLKEGTVIIGCYTFGKAQELIANMNKLDYPVVVTDEIGRLGEVYKRHGIDLDFISLSNASEELKNSPHIFIVNNRILRRPLKGYLRELRDRGARACYISGWCSFFNFSIRNEIDAQFPVSDHADFNSLIEFTQKCNPRKIYTVHGYTEHLAKELRKLGYDANALERGR